MKNLLLIVGLLASHCIIGQSFLQRDSIQSNSFSIEVSSDGAIENWRFKDSVQSIMYQQNLWIGGMSGATLHQSSQTYRQGNVDFSPGPISTDTSSYERYNRVWKVSRAQVDSLKQGEYDTIPEAILNWPAHGDTTFGEPFYLAPYADANKNGYYDPTAGDYPSIRGDEALFFIFNDKADLNTNTLELEIQGMLYRFEDGGVLDSMFFVDYKITNRSQNEYSDTWISSWTDMDMGNHTNDLVGSDIPSDAVFVYNGQAHDSGPFGYGHTLASAAHFLRQGPPADIGNTIDDDRDGCVDAVRDENGNCIPEDSTAGIREHMLMTSSNFYNNSGGGPSNPDFTDPTSDLEERNLMRGLCKDGSYIEINGNDSLWSSTIPNASCGNSQGISFAFPGSSYDSTGSINPASPLEWYESPSDAGDKRVLLSSGPFTFSPGQSVAFRTGFLWHVADSATSSLNGGYYQLLEKLRGSSVTVNNVDTGSSGGTGGVMSISEPLHAPEFHLFYDQAAQSWFIKNNDEPLRFHLYSLQGKRLKQIRLNHGERKMVDLSHLPQGIYLLAEIRSGKTYKLLR